MGDECVSAVLNILKNAGIRAGTDYPASPVPEITGAIAAVGLENWDCGAGKAVFSVKILSPGRMGGWYCQDRAAGAVSALEAAGIHCTMQPMEHRKGRDCFCQEIRAEVPVFSDGTQWHPGSRWEYTWNDAEILGVTEFSALQDLDRRLVGAFCQTEPVAVTPGSGGWRLKLVQLLPAGMMDQTPPAEPFSLVVTGNGMSAVYGGCCWNETNVYYSQSGLRIERQGFALSREVTGNG